MEEDRYTRITLRIPKDLHAKLEAAASATSKSLNAEIVSRLTLALELKEWAALQAHRSLVELKLAAQRSETLTTSLLLFETALALKMAVARNLHPHLPPLEAEEAVQWDKDADEAIAVAQAALAEEGKTPTDLEAASKKFDAAVERWEKLSKA